MSKLFIQQFISARSVVSIITWLVLAMGIAILSSLYYFLQSIDNNAQRALSQRVSLALELDSSHRKQILKEYSYWDEAYENIVLNYSEEWLELYLDYLINDNNNIDFSVAIEKNDQLIYLSTNTESANITFDEVMQQGLTQMALNSAKQDSVAKTVSGYLALGGHLYVVVGAPFVDEDSAAPHVGSYLAFGKQIDDEYIRQLARTHQLAGLQLHLSARDEVNNKILYSPLGKEIGALSWICPSPSTDILPAITIILVSFSLFTLFVTRQILHKEQANRAAYEDKLYIEATQDPLTKVNNRRYFMDMANKSFHLSRKAKKRFTVVIMDIDNFKLLNDTYGHSSGDHVLKCFCEICEKNVREGDIFARIGGEEFAMFLPETHVKKAYEMANRIRELIMETEFPVKGDLVNITVSCGVSSLRQHESFAELLDEADQALYLAKHQGRNRVIIYQAPLSTDKPTTEE